MTPNSGQSPLPPRPMQRKVFDVMRPGRAPANSTSKPIIVSHRPLVQDNSVTLNGVGEPRSLMNPSQKIAISSPDSMAMTTTPPVTAPTPVQPAAPATPVRPLFGTNPDAVQPPDAPPSVTPVRPLVSDNPAPVQPQAATPPQPPAAPQPAQSISTTAPATPPVSDDDDFLDALPAPSIDEPHIAAVAPPKQIGPRSFPVKTVVVCGIVLLFILAVVDILLDADFISWDVPHTHFLD